MRPLAVRDRHPAQHDSASVALAVAIALAIGSSSVACGATVPKPQHVQVQAEDYVPVPYAPRLPPIEIVPNRPAHKGDLVWIDGSWEWSGERFRWELGAWVVPPPGARRARWVIVRRVVDGQLFFAPASWRDASGKAVDPPKPLARASRRAPATTDGPRPPPAPAAGPAGDVPGGGARERGKGAIPAGTDLDE